MWWCWWRTTACLKFPPDSASGCMRGSMWSWNPKAAERHEPRSGSFQRCRPSANWAVVPRGRRSAAVNHGVSPGFEAHQNQSDYGQDDLQTLGALFFRRQLATAPLRGGAVAQVANPGQHGQVDDCAGDSNGEHRDPYCILVETACRRVYPACGSGGGKANGHADPADCEHGGANALQQGENEAGAA